MGFWGFGDLGCLVSEHFWIPSCFWRFRVRIKGLCFRVDCRVFSGLWALYCMGFQGFEGFFVLVLHGFVASKLLGFSGLAP